MPRSLRTLIAGYPHHLVQRGHDRQAVFASDQDYAYYLDNLAEQLALREVTVYAYCRKRRQIYLLNKNKSDPFSFFSFHLFSARVSVESGEGADQGVQ